MIEFAIALGFICILVLVVDIGEIYFRYKALIQKEKLIKEFPTWIGTKKPKIWFVTWSVILCLNVPTLIGVAFWLETIENFLFLFIVIVGYFLLYEIIYNIARAIKIQQTNNIIGK